MKTLEYHWADGTHTVFDNYTIDKLGNVSNVKTGKAMARCNDADGYNRVNVFYEGQTRTILIGRALASTFLGKPSTLYHTAEHNDRIRNNDVLSNIEWKDKSGQNINRMMPSVLKSAFVIERNGIEDTAKGWAEVFKPSDKKYTSKMINKFAQQQRHGFRYKTFPNLRGEVWKYVKGSKNLKGEWFISSKSRVKYKTKYAENVLTADQLSKSGGYPIIRINDKIWRCHELAFMTFRPNEYATKTAEDMILHKEDDKLNFGPFRLRLGTRSENTIDAYNNGKYDNTQRARKAVVSYIGNAFEKEHKSIAEAVRYLQSIEYSLVGTTNIRRALITGQLAYDRTWKSIVK